MGAGKQITKEKKFYGDPQRQPTLKPHTEKKKLGTVRAKEAEREKKKSSKMAAQKHVSLQSRS